MKPSGGRHPRPAGTKPVAAVLMLCRKKLFHTCWWFFLFFFFLNVGHQMYLGWRWDHQNQSNGSPNKFSSQSAATLASRFYSVQPQVTVIFSQSLLLPLSPPVKTRAEIHTNPSETRQSGHLSIVPKEKLHITPRTTELS